MGGEAAEDGALSRRGVLLRLGRHRRWAAAMRPEEPGMARVFGGKLRGRLLRLQMEWERRALIRRGWAGLGCQMGDERDFFLFLEKVYVPPEVS